MPLGQADAEEAAGPRTDRCPGTVHSRDKSRAAGKVRSGPGRGGTRSREEGPQQAQQHSRPAALRLGALALVGWGRPRRTPPPRWLKPGTFISCRPGLEVRGQGTGRPVPEASLPGLSWLLPVCPWAVPARGPLESLHGSRYSHPLRTPARLAPGSSQWPRLHSITSTSLHSRALREAPASDLRGQMFPQQDRRGLGSLWMLQRSCPYGLGPGCRPALGT